MSNEQSKEKIERTRGYLLQSALPEDTKDGLQALLDAAGRAANGTPDKLQAIAEAMLELALHEVKQAVRTPLSIRDEVVAHQTKCKGSTPAGWRGLVVRCAWPLCVLGCVGLFSPHLPAVLQLIAKVAK